MPPTAPTSAPDHSASEVVVRRDITGLLKRIAVLLAIGSFVLFWIPALIVLFRREPGYFTSGILWTALIATALVMGIGLGGAAAKQRMGEAARPLMVLSRDGVRIPASADRAGLDARWEDLALVRLIGRRDQELAFYPRPEAPAHAADDEVTVDLSEPEFLRPLDFQNDPPPPMTAPDRAVYERISPVPEQPDLADEQAAQPQPKGAEALYGTAHVVPVSQTTPPLREVLRAIRELSAGRVALD